MTQSGVPPHRSMSPSGHDLPVGEDWRDYRRAILDDLNELKRENKELRDLLVKQSNAIAILTTKVTLYAAGVGLVTSGFVAVASELISHFVGK